MAVTLRRREFLRVVPLMTGAILLAACGAESPTTPQASTAPAASTAPGSIAPAASPRTAAASPAASQGSAPTTSTAPAAATPVSSPAASGGANAPVKGGTLTWGGPKLPKNSINPLTSLSTQQNFLIDAIFTRLVYGREWGNGVSPQASGPIEMGIAEKMTEVEKDRVWEFTLRKNAKWHDGKPVTADDVIFGIWLAHNKDTKSSASSAPYSIKGAAKLKADGGGSLTPPYNVVVEGATKLNDYAVRIELEKPIVNYWVNWGTGYWPMPKHILGELPMDKIFAEPYATMPIGNGPFKASKFVDGQYMELVANDDFFLGRPLLDKWIVRFGDTDTLSAALEAQEIDGTGVGAGPAYDRLVGLPHLTGNLAFSALPIGFAVNVERFPKEAATLNKAIMYAIDVPTLSKQLYSNTLQPSNYLFEHVVGLEQPPAGFPKYTYDPAKAQALLKQINWDPNKELAWINWSKPGVLQDAMQAMLMAVGIKATYKIIDTATVIEQLYQKADYDIVHANFQGDQNMEFNWRNIKCGWLYDKGGFNYARYCNAEVDAFWEKGLQATDAKVWKDSFDQATLKIAENPPQATLWRAPVPYVWNKRVQGAYPYQYQAPVRPPFERVWIKK